VALTKVAKDFTQRRCLMIKCQNDCGAIWRSLDYTKQCCLFCYLCYCLPNL